MTLLFSSAFGPLKVGKWDNYYSTVLELREAIAHLPPEALVLATQNADQSRTLLFNILPKGQVLETMEHEQ